MRCRSLASKARTDSDANQGLTRGFRNAHVTESWYHRTRDYTVLAACQPHELVAEHVDDRGDVHGALTLFMVEALDALRPTRSTLSYRQLRENLGARIKERYVAQNPMMLGQENRFAFEAETVGLGSDAGTAIITNDGQSSVLLNRGSVGGVGLGDVFRVFHYSFLWVADCDNERTTEIAVKFVDGL